MQDINWRKTMSGPQTKEAQFTHADHYREEGEDFREGMNRVANALKSDEAHFHKLRDYLMTQALLPGGRIQKAAGSIRNVTMHNCFVSGTIADSYVEGEGCIMDRLKEAAATMRLGGGIGYDFSTLRPRGDTIRKLGSKSSGPLSFMRIYDANCGCVQSAGHRRGAQMGIMRVDHPDIQDFIHAKAGSGEFKNFNLSVAITDEFMDCLINDKPFTLKFKGEEYETVSASSLWDMIMRATYDHAEPGVLFIDRINSANNLRYCETIAATNPCGEQPLPPFGACLLGSVNLTKFVQADGDGWKFDLEMMKDAVRVFVRALDNVVDRSIYPLEAQKKEAISKRRMGIGVTGLANTIEACLGRACYGEPMFIQMMHTILQAIAETAYRESIEIAKEKGPFPLFDAEQFLAPGTFASKLSTEVQDLIRKHGIRNSHLLSIAPTGTISLAADNISSGVEPVIVLRANRKVRTFDGHEVMTVEDYGLRVFGIEGKTSKDVTIDQHIAVLAKATQWVDSAVSKTCNVPTSMDFQEFKDVYKQAWQLGCKGCTTFRENENIQGIIQEAPAQESSPVQACFIDQTTGRRECS